MERPSEVLLCWGGREGRGLGAERRDGNGKGGEERKCTEVSGFKGGEGFGSEGQY